MNAASSDKENSNPQTAKRKSTSTAAEVPSRSSTGLSVQGVQANKRRRMENSLNTRLQEQLSQYPRQEETEEEKYYNPDQNEDLRRDLRMGMRENRAELIGT
jgi:hypothetical protein